MSEVFDDEVSVCVKVELLFRIKVDKGASEIVGSLGVTENVCVWQKGTRISYEKVVACGATAYYFLHFSMSILISDETS